MRSKLVPPQLPPALEDSFASALVDEASLLTSCIVDADASYVEARHMAWDELKLERVALSSAKLEGLKANDVIVEDCDLAAAKCADTSWLRALFTGGRMSGWDANKSLLQDVEFRNCKLDVSNFRFATLQRVTFVDCILTEADFIEASLQHVRFQGCLLERTDFNGAKLQDVDLRSSQLLSIQGWKTMKGARIDGVQLMSIAPHLAAELGLVIQD